MPAAQTAEFGNFLLAGSQTVSNSSASLVSGDSLLTVTQNTTFGDTLSSANVGIYSTSGSALFLFRAWATRSSSTGRASTKITCGRAPRASNTPAARFTAESEPNAEPERHLAGGFAGIGGRRGWGSRAAATCASGATLTFCTQFEVTPQGTGNSFDASAILTFEIASLGPIDVLTCTASPASQHRATEATGLRSTPPLSARQLHLHSGLHASRQRPLEKPGLSSFSTATTTGGGIPFLT